MYGFKTYTNPFDRTVWSYYETGFACALTRTLVFLVFISSNRNKLLISHSLLHRLDFSQYPIDFSTEGGLVGLE